MKQEETVRVMVIQGHCLLREAFIERLEKEGWLEVCAVAAGLNEEAKDLIRQHQPDVLVMNVSLKCCAGLTLLKKLKREIREVAILAFSCNACKRRLKSAAGGGAV